MREKYGNGSLTALPIIETQAGDVSAYIPTNVISITDGQIFLETDLFYQGVRPAVSVGISVSRVGSAAQVKAMKQVAGRLKGDLAQFRELAAFAQFGSDLDAKTPAQIDRGKRIMEVFKQPPYNPIPIEIQVAVLWVAQNGFIDDVPVDKVKEFQGKLTEFLTTRKPELLAKIRKEQGPQRRADGRVEGRRDGVQTDLQMNPASNISAARGSTRPFGFRVSAFGFLAMPSTRDIRRRIKSVKSTAQITKAMQMVASSKMQQGAAGRHQLPAFRRHGQRDHGPPERGYRRLPPSADGDAAKCASAR